jgi:hypothetical protein
VLRELTIKAGNISAKLFEAESPVSLTRAGRRLLEESGLKSYIDLRRRDLVSQLQRGTSFDLYGIPDAAFQYLGRLRFEEWLRTTIEEVCFRKWAQHRSAPEGRGDLSA